MRNSVDELTGHLSVADELRIDDACACFESQLRGGQAPRLEPLLLATETHLRTVLLCELVLIEVEWLGERGIPADRHSYINRFPDHAARLNRLFSAFPFPDGGTDHGSSAGDTQIIAGANPKRFGHYLIVGQIGRGGMGTVYKALDVRLNRHVALKVIRHVSQSRQPRAESDGKWVDAFFKEARAVALLDHPHIVPVYDVGISEDEQYYVVSKFIDGQNLAERIATAEFDARTAAELVAALADALHHTHSRGLVHRDIKPSNIILDNAGRPFLADFGLALRDGEDTIGSGLIGTLGYMSPEQARGEGHRVDHRSDIFSLGVVLFELLTGHQPFTAQIRSELIQQIQSQDPIPPRHSHPECPAELERICLRAMAKKTTHRYPTAKDLADDLQWFLDLQTRSTELPANPRLLSVGSQSGDSAKSDTPSGESELMVAPRMLPKGLRSFDSQDAGFFLELLPGPRDRNGIPESVRFWMSRLECLDPNLAFSVGVMYGPSGCGKSSLLNAGLLPRLPASISVVRVEATPDDTEASLLRELRRCRSLPEGLGLADSIANLRRETNENNADKVLLVIDQLEQWLHNRTIDEHQQLVRALRHCDGGRVQALLLVRDDFWMATVRLMREIEILAVEGSNAAAVDRFDLAHARKVLTAHGRAIGALPGGLEPLSPGQELFVTQALRQLATDDRVVGIRLALFVEIFKNRQWNVENLQAVGGAHGIGTIFLEEVFSPNASSRIRSHELAARRVLEMLLPATGVEIKGRMRSRSELLKASGYTDHDSRFDDLIQLLDGELRLLTMAEVTGRVSGTALAAGFSHEIDSTTPVASAISLKVIAIGLPAPASDNQPMPRGVEVGYQLTHDYLTPSVREWLTRKYRETWRGRAKLCLTERASQWSEDHDSRFLPSLGEYLSIQAGVPGRMRNGAERLVLRQATLRYGVRSGLALFLLAMTLAVIAWSSRNTNQQRAESLGAAIESARPEVVPGLLATLRAGPEQARELLWTRFRDPQSTDRTRLRAAIALAELGDVEQSFLLERVLDAPFTEFRNLLTAIQGIKQAAAAYLFDRYQSASDPELKARIAIFGLYVNELRPTADSLAWTSDPSQRTTFLQLFPQWHADLAPIAKLIQDPIDPAVRSGLCLALGKLNADELDDVELSVVRDALATAHHNAVHGSTLSASRWALASLGQPIAPRPDSKSLPQNRNSFVNQLGITMIRLEPGVFEMGSNSPLVQRGFPAGPPHMERIESPFYLADSETTVAMYANFVTEAPYLDKDVMAQIGALKLAGGPSDLAMSKVSWLDAVHFCNWLSKLESRQPCYTVRKRTEMIEGDAPAQEWICDFQADGYRLPSEAEWEYACRAGTTTSWSFGNDGGQLARHAVFNSNSMARVQPVRQWIPNNWGLFDMHGNLWEWCGDHARLYDSSQTLSPSEQAKRILRGGSWSDLAAQCHSAYRIAYTEASRLHYMGFRVACGTAE